MRIVLDANVLVSALLSPFGPPARILAEYGDVTHRPRLSIDAAKADDVLEELRRSGFSVASVPLPRPLLDHDDDPFVEVGLAGGARCLVTGNGAHFPDDRCLGLLIVSPPSSSQSCAAGCSATAPIDAPLAAAVALSGISQLTGSRCKTGAAPQL